MAYVLAGRELSTKTAVNDVSTAVFVRITGFRAGFLRIMFT
jgi:hypothetical protein